MKRALPKETKAVIRVLRAEIRQTTAQLTRIANAVVMAAGAVADAVVHEDDERARVSAETWAKEARKDLDSNEELTEYLADKKNAEDGAA